jgi:proteasome alpha subunit
VSFPYFISPEQAMRERSELARQGIARGRSVVALAYSGGVLFVAENPSRSLQKVSELYDRVGSRPSAGSTSSTTCAAAVSSSPTLAATPMTVAM